MIKDYLEHQGFVKIIGSRDAIRIAFQNGIIEDGENWMKMIDDRIKSVHTYDEETVKFIEKKIFSIYFDLFLALKTKMINLS